MFKILKVIHGFVPDFMAGSEVYSYNLCKELAKNHQVFVFARIENEFDVPYSIYDEIYQSKENRFIKAAILSDDESNRSNLARNEAVSSYTPHSYTWQKGDFFIRRINKPKEYNYLDKFYDSGIDSAFRKYLECVNPDIVHFGHLSHLSINLVRIAKECGKKVVFTLHDFWLYCVRGQLITQSLKQCSGASIEKCKACSPYKNITDSEVLRVLNNLAEVRESIDMFISPSYTLRKYCIQNGIDSSKIIYQKYGFDTTRIAYKKRFYAKDDSVRFGYMGRIIPSKGINLLLEAWQGVAQKYPKQKLRIYGEIGKNKRFLKGDNVEFRGGYDNDRVNDILQDIDVLIVPSIWLENAPLVIQEAFLAGVAVVSSDKGGMYELIQDNRGISFESNNAQSLQSVLENIIANPTLLNALPDNRGYVDSIQKDCEGILRIYSNLLETKRPNKTQNLRRITIDTNPDTCNFKCKMCDTHSIYNKDFKHLRKDMPLPLLEQALSAAKNAGVREIIPTTMGEPTLYKYFDTIVQFCKNNDVKLNLTTNGSQLFGKKYDEAYIRENLLAVLSDIKISLNSLDSSINESIMIQSDTKAILEKIERLCALRDSVNKQVSITLQMTFMRSNLDSIIPLIEYAITKGINRIKGHQLWITHKELEKEALHNDREWIARWNNLVASLKQYRGQIRLENFTPLDSHKENGKECPFLGRELWINYKGDISVCCAPDKQRSELGDFGNIQSRTLLEVLHSQVYQNLLQTYHTKEVCKSCQLKK